MGFRLQDLEVGIWRQIQQLTSEDEACMIRQGIPFVQGGFDWLRFSGMIKDFIPLFTPEIFSCRVDLTGMPTRLYFGLGGEHLKWSQCRKLSREASISRLSRR